MLGRLSEAITNAGIPLERVEGTINSPILIFQAVATQQQRTQAATIVSNFDFSKEAHLLWLLEKEKIVAAEVINQSDINAKVLRAVVVTLIDEINTLRGWLTSLKAQIAASSSLTDLRNRVNTLPAVPNRTLAQARTAITAKVLSGEAD
jgi:hypothetical protein